MHPPHQAYVSRGGGHTSADIRYERNPNPALTGQRAWPGARQQARAQGLLVGGRQPGARDRRPRRTDGYQARWEISHSVQVHGVESYIYGVPKKFLVVVVLAWLGFIAGFAFAARFPSYEHGGMLVLPAHSPHSAVALVHMTRDDHPGVKVVAYGSRSIDVSASGSSFLSADMAAARAADQAIRDVIAANNGKFQTRLPDMTLPAPSGRYILLCLIAEMSAALGFLVPPRSRLAGVRD